MSNTGSFSPRFKASIALASIQGVSVSRLAKEHGLDPKEVLRWRARLEARADEIFENLAEGNVRGVARHLLDERIRERKLKDDFLAGC